MLIENWINRSGGWRKLKKVSPKQFSFNNQTSKEGQTIKKAGLLEYKANTFFIHQTTFVPKKIPVEIGKLSGLEKEILRWFTS